MTESIGPAFLHTIELCLGPSVFMLLMSYAIFLKAPSSTFVNMMQHFGGGIVLSAVATELLPAMSKHKHSWQNTLATLIGFFLGVAMMVSVAHFCGEVEEEEEEEEEEEAEAEQHAVAAAVKAHHPPTLPKKVVRLASPTPPSSPMRGMVKSGTMGRRKSLMETYRQAALEQQSAFSPSSPLFMRKAITMRGPTDDSTLSSPLSPSSPPPTKAMNRSKTQGAPIRKNNRMEELPPIPPPASESTSLLSRNNHQPSIASALENGELERKLLLNPLSPPSHLPTYGAVPWTLVVPVFVDSFMDGLLIGLAAVAGKSAGLVMSIALTIEMGFLGLTFSAGVSKVPPMLRNALVIGAPLMILVGGSVGALAAALLAANPVYQVGLVSFGVAALLYLITEELLVEAHEDGAPHIWYVDFMFFVGFIASVLLEQSIQDASGE